MQNEADEHAICIKREDFSTLFSFIFCLVFYNNLIVNALQTRSKLAYFRPQCFCFSARAVSQRLL
ncbi:hypothetical protein HMPREF0971_00663 [Segatella oris F0302]|uniref:Uncharacterized protein n=1 Tax=Segatella oris F0302 TaxID=649760 RepID=D1QNZ4_9BACT|nr:hypothetical protein HMPREF0971_00663 [Segatella oris F0302]